MQNRTSLLRNFTSHETSLFKNNLNYLIINPLYHPIKKYCWLVHVRNLTVCLDKLECSIPELTWKTVKILVH